MGEERNEKAQVTKNLKVGNIRIGGENSSD